MYNGKFEVSKGKLIQIFILAILIIIVFCTPAIMDKLAEVVIRLGTRLFGAEKDASTAAHLGYYSDYIKILKNSSLSQIIFAYGYGCSGYTITELYGRYADGGTWAIECDYVNILVSRGIIGFISYYSFLLYIMLKGIKIDIRYFIFIGRFSGEKNPELLIRAFKQIGAKQVGLIMLGEGPLWEDLKKEGDDRILLPGFKTNVYDYLIASDYYISASDVEGLANTLLESMTVGLPMLLSDIPSHQEVLSKMSVTTGYIFNNKDSNSLFDKIEKVLLLDRTEVAREVQDIFQKHYTAKKMSLSYQNAYTSL